MSKINKVNQEKVMFRLADRLCQPRERDELLSEIASDPRLSEEWRSWEKTILEDPLHRYEDEAGALASTYIEKHRKIRKVRLYYLFATTGIAAMFLIWIGLKLSSILSPGAGPDHPLAGIKPSSKAPRSDTIPVSEATMANNTPINLISSPSQILPNLREDSSAVKSQGDTARSEIDDEPVMAVLPSPRPETQYAVSIVTERSVPDQQSVKLTATGMPGDVASPGQLLTNTKMKIILKSDGSIAGVLLEGNQHSAVVLPLESSGNIAKSDYKPIEK